MMRLFDYSPADRRIKAMTLEEFAHWLRAMSDEGIRTSIQIWGKPRVRVPVVRQTPNEADL